ncbi:MAG: hypothetical protein V7675_04305 [Hyphomonas sp.]|uniref:hypothetical protein n=1 Tax=Hyphomonas sp. TaxID=87 RepID=UPI0030037243
MLRAFLILCAGFSLGLTARADMSACAGPSEQSCMFEAIWDAAAPLPPEKKARIQPFFLETVGKAGDAALLRAWQTRLGAAASHRSPSIDYTADQASAVVAESGWDGFEQRARAGAVPFNTGRPEIMAAGVRLAPDAATKRRLTEAMFDLAHTKATRGGMGDNFEKSDFGHALAELSMQACDLNGFDRAVTLTAAPDSLRYALWRTRITGHAGVLATRIRNEASADDTRHVRGALEGYAPVVSIGYCAR